MKANALRADVHTAFSKRNCSSLPGCVHGCSDIAQAGVQSSKTINQHHYMLKHACWLFPSAGLADILRHHIYVGMADHTLALVQYSTRLYLLNAQALTSDMFYQQVYLSFFALKLTKLG